MQETTRVDSGFYGNRTLSVLYVSNRYQPIRVRSIVADSPLIRDSRVELTAPGYNKLKRRARITE